MNAPLTDQAEAHFLTKGDEHFAKLVATEDLAATGFAVRNHLEQLPYSALCHEVPISRKSGNLRTSVRRFH
jgi:hypothetical protein